MRISATLLVIILLAGCAGSGASTRASNTYRENLGAYPPGNIVRTLDEALQTRYGYRFARQEESVQDIYYETDWLDLQGHRRRKSNGNRYGSYSNNRQLPAQKQICWYGDEFFCYLSRRSTVAGQHDRCVRRSRYDT